MDELTRLRKENKELKRILKEYGYIFVDENIQLNREQRLEIFMNYFKGRTDVYADKYFSKKHQRYIYTFACDHKFIKNVCPIGRQKV